MWYSVLQLVGKSVSEKASILNRGFFYSYRQSRPFIKGATFLTTKKLEMKMKKVKEVIGFETKVEQISPQSASTERDDGYLARQAGLQTVQTSMRGILRSNDNAPQRKKLLGE